MALSAAITCNEGDQLPVWWTVFWGGLVLLIALGALTPLACLISVLMELGTHVQMTQPLETAVTVLITIALGALGPGAYSIDAKLFGRRLIVRSKD